MKKITTGVGVFGPYRTITALADRYRADGADLPFTVVGTGTIADVEPGDFPPPPATQEQRATICTAIRTERDRRKFNGVFVSGKWIHTDTYSRTQWMGMVMMGAGIPAIDWTTMDGTSITTSQALASAVFAATATLDATLFAYAKSLIAQVQASDDPASIDVATGWPATFVGAV